MHAYTEPPEILFISTEDVSRSLSVASDGRSVSQLTWDGDRASLPQELPDCVVLSETLGTDTVIEITRTLRETKPTVPIVAFVDDQEEPVEALFDAGVTDIICGTVPGSAPALVERRIEAACSLNGGTRTGGVATGEGTDYEPVHLLREVTENINDVVWVNSLDGDGLEYVNSAYEDVWGRSREALYEDRETLLETVHPEDRERVREAMERQLELPEAYDETYRVVRPDGEQRWVHSRAVGVREDGRLERIVGVATDITQRKTHQDQLAAERDLMERTLETSPVGIVVMDTTGTIARANEQAGTILGLSKSALEGAQYAPDGVSICYMDGEELPDSEFPFNRIKATGEPLRDEKYIVEYPDAEDTVISVDGVPLFDEGSLERVVITFDDVTEQVVRERRLEEQRDELAELNHINRIIRAVQEALLGTRTREEILQAVCDNLTASDRYRDAVALQSVGERSLEAKAWTAGSDGLVETLFSPSGAVTATGLPNQALARNETQVVQQVEDLTELGDWDAVLKSKSVDSFAVIPVVYGGIEYGVIVVSSSERETFSSRKLSVLDELGETVGHAVAAVESRQREQTLTSLYEATEEFLTAETSQEISDVAVETAIEVLDLSGIGIFQFDDETNLLAPVAGTDTFLEFFGESPVFGPGKEDSITWHTYVTGEPQCFTDVRESDRLAKPDTSARASLLIPLGEHGVFVAASREPGIFTEQKRQLVGLLAATTEAAFDRVAGQADIRERDAALEERTRQLERIERLLSAGQDITELIRNAKTRTELEAELCEQLVEYDCISLAWVGHRPSDSDELEPRAWAGSEEGYLDAISLGLGGDEPALQTAATGETNVVPNVTAQIRENPWAREAIDRGYQSALAVPLANGDTDYGVLVVYSTEPGTFGDVVENTAVEFGSTIAYGINSVETRRGILDERATELEIYLGRTETFLNAVSAIVEEPVSYRDLAPLDDNTTQILFQLSHPPVEEILELQSEFVAIDSLTHTRRGETHLFRANVSGQTVAAELLDCGGIPREVTATPSETRAIVRLSTELDVREFLDRLSEHHPEAELRSRYEADSVEDTVGDVRDALEARLTDRQREVLVTAYESGFFQSPRETTGEELAELLDLSQPTVTHHLREAQHRLFTALLDDS